VIQEAPGWLAPGGVLVVEVAAEQGGAAAAAAERAGLRAEIRTAEESDATVVIARLP
jgi:release factor glutamine methyltransferase